jgi:hypothetical protein
VEAASVRFKLVRGRKAQADDDVLDVLGALERLAERRRTTVVTEVPDAAAPLADGSPRHTGRLLGSLLVLRGYIVADELDSILEYQAASGKRLGEIAVEMGLISDRILAELLAEQLRLPVVDLAKVKIDRAVACSIPYSEARQTHAIPTRRRGDCIEVAIADPTNQEFVVRLNQSLGAPLRLGVAPASTIAAALDDVWATPRDELTG